MPRYELEVTEIASATYTVEAASPEEAQAKLERGEWESWRDLGHDSPEIHAVRALAE